MDYGETLDLKVIVLSERPPQKAKLYSRPLGQGAFVAVPLRHVARDVYRGELGPATNGTDLEYFRKVIPAQGEPVHFPATAPAINQTVVVMPREHVASK